MVRGIHSGNLYRVLGVKFKHVLEPTMDENVLGKVLTSQKEFVDKVNICEPLGCTVTVGSVVT